MPLLTLGIPTSATAAILLAAFQNYGIQPGPLLFVTQADLVWTLIASLYVGNVLLLVLNLPLIGMWVKVLEVPKPQLYAGILIFATLGAYSLHQSITDLLVLAGFGLLGFVMRRHGFPTAPAVIGLILGPMAETQLRRALSISQGDMTVFLTAADLRGLPGDHRAAGHRCRSSCRHYRKRRERTGTPRPDAPISAVDCTRRATSASSGRLRAVLLQRAQQPPQPFLAGKHRAVEQHLGPSSTSSVGKVSMSTSPASSASSSMSIQANACCG